MNGTEILRARAQAALERHFGFSEYRPGQEEAILHLLGGRSAAAVFPTGGGKSLCYQLPALLLDGLTLVVSPLIALMKDQIDALTARGIPALRLDSSLDKEAYRAAMDGIRSGQIRLLYVAPERFNNERFRRFLGSCRIALFAVDEAHCISEWGHNFRPDYLKLAHFAREAGAERIFALTATATPKVLEEICRLFDIDPSCAVRTPFHRPNLSLRVRNVSARERDAELVAELRAQPPGPTIVYVTVQRTAERVAELLGEEGFTAKAYHAGMETEVRASTQEWFLESEDGIIVATIAFGMGIDKANIRYVHHYNSSKSLESYSQEIGRAGRDGLPSRCVSFYCPADLLTLQNFAYGDTPTRAAVAGLVGDVFAQGERFDLSLHALAGARDIRLLVVRTLLVYLELDGYLEGGTPLYSTFRFIPQMSSGEMVAPLDPARRDFLIQLFHRVKKGRSWMTIDVADVAAELGIDRGRIVSALEYLSDRGCIQLEAKGVRYRFTVVRQPESQPQLVEELHGRLVERESREIGRLEQAVALLQGERCLPDALGRHFGEALAEPCGHCSVCLGEDRGALPPVEEAPALDEAEIAVLRREHPDLFAEPRVLARFLCGVGSPAITRARLRRHELFGALSAASFPQVLERLRE